MTSPDKAVGAAARETAERERAGRELAGRETTGRPIVDREADALHTRRLALIEASEAAVVALATSYRDGYRVSEHRHGRAQLLHPRSGVVLVTTGKGRWMVPPGHAMWIPPGATHAVDMIGAVDMQSLYVLPDALGDLTGPLSVLGLTDLMRSLLAEAVALPPEARPTGRAGLVMGLVLAEIGNLETRPLAIPFPGEPAMAAMCRRFVEAPDAHATIDEWARALGMSRRSFTRSFARQTGLSFSRWRRQACLVAALPRLTAGEPVTTVALDMGYESVPAFTTMFRKTLGTTPKAWAGRRAAGR